MSRLWHHSASCILITGKKGTGKSTKQIELVKRFKGRIFIFDHKLEFAHKLGWRAQTDFEQMKQATAQGQPVLFYPARLYPLDRREAFDTFCRWVFEVSLVLPGKKLLVVDEVQEWTDVWQTGIGDGFQLVLNDGRLRGIDLLLISQIPNDVNKKIRAQITEVYCFKHTDGLILKWLSTDPFCLDPGEVSSLRKPGGWVYRNVDTDELKRNDHAGTRQKAVQLENQTGDLVARNIARLPRRDEMEKGQADLHVLPVRKNLRRR